jgi:PAS domain S-box-containing protein
MKFSTLSDRILISAFMADIPDLVYFKDRQGRFVSVSHSLARILGHSAEEMIGKTIFEFLDEEQSHAIHDLQLELMRKDEPLIGELMQRTWPDGRINWYVGHHIPLRNARGKVIGIYGMSRDVTASKITEMALAASTEELKEANARLEAANADLRAEKLRADQMTEAALAASHAKSQFVANMSHEIRTPMNGVIGMTDLLFDTPLDPIQRKYAESIRDSAAALLTVINDVLDFSKVEAGKLELEEIEMNLGETVEDVARLISIQADAKGLEVTANIDTALPEALRGDPARVRQILLNLCANAVKFTASGEIAIEVSVLETDEQGTSVRIAVRDTGIGIAEDRLHMLFEPFTQVDASTTRRFGGTGLGLSIVKRFAELMGGSTGVESQKGVGSTFWFTARFGVASGARRTRPRGLKALHGQSALIVDDNETNRRVLSAQLKGCGLEPACAPSAHEALRMMRRAHKSGHPFQVALIDHQMPGCDGAQLGRLINADLDLKSTRLVLLTSSGQHHERQTVAELGFAGYLLKPVIQRDLIDVLPLVLAGAAKDWHTGTLPIITRQQLQELRGRDKRRILVAEDNAVNRMVACRLLQKMGYRVDIVNDGRQAVAAWKSGRYDLIVMDCQMPELNGYEAAMEIRRLEADGPDKRHIPIIALTAHAMPGAERECKAAGMDAYLSKPIDRARLESYLDDLLSHERGAGDAHTTRQERAEDSSLEVPVDLTGVKLLADGDVEFQRQIVRAFAATARASIVEVKAALERGDAKALARAAHAIKGASASIQATAASRAAAALESAARGGDGAGLNELAQGLQHEIGRAVDYLENAA